MIAHIILLYIDHDTATAIAEPKLIPVDAVVDLFIDILFSLYDDRYKFTMVRLEINKLYY